MANGPSLSFGLVNSRPVFMDPTNDCYFALSREDEHAFLKALDRNPPTCGSTAEPRPEALAVGIDRQPIVEAHSPPPNSSLLDLVARERAPSPGDLLRIAYLRYRVRLELSRKSMASLLMMDEAPAAKPRKLRKNGEIVDLALRYIKARTLLPRKANCLVDTLTLARWLGPAPGLLMIFGVKLDPFAAHCWAQLEDMVLNDRCDYVTPFQPVRVIECMPASH